jgi:uncharacterized damage-inducible protein DinB
MVALDMVRGLVAYNYALNDKLWESIMQLSEEQFVAEIPYSHGSVRNQAVHVAGVDGRWLRGLRGEPDARSFRPAPEDYPTRQAARELWDGVAADFKAYVAALGEDDLAAVPPGMKEPRWQIITQVVNHGTDHRAQLLRILHDFGAPTFGQDLIMFWWQFKAS